jgi:hypothetical protein
MEHWMCEADLADHPLELPKSSSKRTLMEAFGSELAAPASKKHCPPPNSLCKPKDVPSLDEDSSNYASAEDDSLFSEENTVSSLLLAVSVAGDSIRK